MMTRSENDSSPGEADVAGLDALDGEHGPARPLSAHEAARVTDRVMRQLELATRVGSEASRGPRSALGRQLRRWPRWLLVGAGATLATAAAAVYGTDWLSPSPQASNGNRADHSLREEAPREEALQEEVPRDEPRPTTPEDSIDPDGRPTHAPPESSTGDHGRDARTIAHESRRAADHLARANALRGEHRYREALDRYLYVVSEYPGSMQGQAARLAAAAIRLEQLTDIDGAEELYQAVRQTSDGELAAQASFGLAEVARARADRGAETRALREFLTHHGGHPLAAAARRRLGALESP
jgi:hypothetical protein